MTGIRLRIAKATPDEIRTVALAMRDIDLHEFLAVSHATNRDELAGSLVDRLGSRQDILVFALDEPIAIGGTIEGRPNVITLLFYATDRFRDIAVPLNRWITRELFPRLMSAGVHRLETIALHDNIQTHRWLRTLGLLPETGPLARYGKNGEDFVQFALVAGDAG